MASNTIFREMPNKPLPISLLIDLRRRGIRVPQEIQMRIMWYKERMEMEEMKEAVMEEVKDLIVCPRLRLAKYCGKKPWKSVFERPKSDREVEQVPPCHWCSKVFLELLPIGARAEVSRPQPNLTHLYNECSWLAMHIYHERSPEEPVGMQLRNGNIRTPQLNSVETIMQWMTNTTAVVDDLLNLNRLHVV